MHCEDLPGAAVAAWDLLLFAGQEGNGLKLGSFRLVGEENPKWHAGGGDDAEPELLGRRDRRPRRRCFPVDGQGPREEREAVHLGLAAQGPSGCRLRCLVGDNTVGAAPCRQEEVALAAGILHGERQAWQGQVAAQVPQGFLGPLGCHARIRDDRLLEGLALQEA